MTTFLGAQPVTRRRYGAVSVVDHEVVRPTPSEVVVRASVQPVKGEELENVPEGSRHSDMRKMYSDLDWRAADQHAGTPADEALVDGRVYEVVGVMPYPALQNHSKVLLARVDE